MREEVDRLQVELNQTTNRNVTLIEDRLNALSEALGKADKKILLFRREAEKQEMSGKLYTELSARRHLGEAVPAAAAPVAAAAPAAASRGSACGRGRGVGSGGIDSGPAG